MQHLIDTSDKQPFIKDVQFIKELIKNLEDTVYAYYPKHYTAILPMLHKAYDSMAIIMYKLNIIEDNRQGTSALRLYP